MPEANGISADHRRLGRLWGVMPAMLPRTGLRANDEPNFRMARDLKAKQKTMMFWGASRCAVAPSACSSYLSADNN
jgi:hypothetical protein